MKQKINLQINCNNIKIIPDIKKIKKWINIILKQNYEVTIRIVEILEIQNINFMYRKKNKPTNILSFPFQPPKFIKSILLGDLIICADIIYQESLIYKKDLNMRWAHIIIHGVLHLLGYLHSDKYKKKNMEKKEILAMKKLGYKHPYLI